MMDYDNIAKVNQPERILCAAIWYKEYPYNSESSTVKNVEGLVMIGRRHHNIISTVHNLLGKSSFQMGKHIQGFLTSKDRFVDRYEALLIAKEQNQILNLDDVRGQLYSEDLY